MVAVEIVEISGRDDRQHGVFFDVDLFCSLRKTSTLFVRKNTENTGVKNTFDPEFFFSNCFLGSFIYSFFLQGVWIKMLMKLLTRPSHNQ